MKILFTILTLLPLLITAQNISVKSFKLLQGDMDARVNHPVQDQNGDKCALIKMVTTQKGFQFEGDMNGISKTEYKTGEYWIYVPYGSKALTIKHEQLGVLRNWNYTLPIKEATVYEMVLTTANVKMVVEETVIPTNWLIVTSEPTGADLYIDGVHKGTTPFQQELEEGEYSYSISTDLYHAQGGKFSISANGNRTEIKAKLKPNFGFAKITTTPENGAAIYINGTQLSNTTPCTTKRLKPGTYSLKVEKPMFFSETKEITIIDGQTIDVAINLRPTFGGFTIKTSPENGATVILDGETTNKITPCTLERLSDGEHTITLRKEWYQPKTVKINAKAGENQEQIITLSPTFGTINITADHNAKIYIDNDFKANGTWSGKLIAGYHTIEAKLEKYETDSKKVKIELGQTSNLSLHPTPQYGSLKVVTNPFDATIKLNGEDKGLSPKNINKLLVGTYSLVLEKQGYGTVSKSITINENQTLEVNETLPSGKEVTINSTPQGTRLFIDNVEVGTTPYNGTLSFGSYTIRLVNGKKIVNEKISVSQTGKTSWSFDVSEFIETFIDKRDGKTYKAIQIGNQIWMAENINYKTNDSYCYEDNSSMCQKYGRLYTWQAAKNACPTGWHLPTKAEFDTLFNNIGGEGKGAYVALKEGGSSGFNALFSGHRSNDDHYYYKGYYGYFCSSSEFSKNNVWYLYFDNYFKKANMHSNYYKRYGFSVRCIKD